MLQFSCPHCSQAFEVRESQTGEVTPCPLCGKDVQIPAAPPTTPGELATSGVLSGPVRTSGLAIGSLVCGLIMCVPPASLAGIVLGIVALTQIGNPANRLTGRGLAIAGIITGVIGCTIVPIAMLMSLVLPAFSSARTMAAQMQGNVQIRGIHQGCVFHSQANGGYYPGLDNTGQVTDATVEGRFLVLLQNGYLSGEYIISPSETKTAWVSGGLDTSMYSYSMLQIADAAGRQAEWTETNNPDAVVLADRAIVRPDGIGSIHTEDARWRGNVGWNDNHVSFEPDHLVATDYDGQITANDNLFEPAGGTDAYLIYSGED